MLKGTKDAFCFPIFAARPQFFLAGTCLTRGYSVLRAHAAFPACQLLPTLVQTYVRTMPDADTHRHLTEAPSPTPGKWLPGWDWLQRQRWFCLIWRLFKWCSGNNRLLTEKVNLLIFNFLKLWFLIRNIPYVRYAGIVWREQSVLGLVTRCWDFTANLWCLTSTAGGLSNYPWHLFLRP